MNLGMDVVTNNNIVQQAVLRTGSGVFYEGMTLADAKQIGRDKCLMRRDFSNIDKNKDNVLTSDEIMQERDKEVKRLRFDGFLASSFALMDAVSTFKKFSLWNIAFATLFSLFAVDSFSRMKKLDSTNKSLKHNLNIDV